MEALQNLIDILNRIADDNTITVGAKAIEQKKRNAMKKELTEALYEVLAKSIANLNNGSNPLLQLYRTEKGMMIGVDNEKVGIIPIEFQVAVKNMDCDPAEENEAYMTKLAEQADKKARAEANKAIKIARQAQERALKQQLREIRNSDKPSTD